MKTLVITFDNVTTGDLVIVNAEPKAGGKISAKHYVVQDDTPIVIAQSLCAQINHEWMPECARAKVKEDTGALIVNCLEPFADVNITIECDGDTTTAMSEF